MLTIGTMPLLLKIAAKLDINPIIERVKNADVFADADNAEDAFKQLSPEKVGELGAGIIADIAPQLGKIADDLPPLVAAYKGVPVAEANALDAAEVINEIIRDEGIRTFFKRALLPKVEHGA